MRYWGVAVGPSHQHLCAIQEVRTPEPPIRLQASFYEPGPVEAVIGQVRALGDAVVAIGAPVTRPADGAEARVCDLELRRRGVPPQPLLDAGPRLYEGLSDLGRFVPEPGAREGAVEEGTFRTAGAVETNPDAVFCALQSMRVPAKRHPVGVQRRIEELLDNHVEDGGGDLWHRRIEEVEAAACALAAHRYAVGLACWVGDPGEGVIVLPGASLPERFPTEGALPPVTRLPLGGEPS
jgi:predicted nuclease with RNAse H fold